jgi:hypothetical protein
MRISSYGLILLRGQTLGEKPTTENRETLTNSFPVASNPQLPKGRYQKGHYPKDTIHRVLPRGGGLQTHDSCIVLTRPSRMMDGRGNWEEHDLPRIPQTLFDVSHFHIPDDVCGGISDR